ncbi:MAG TPA: Hsp20/alpha crystallin family protein [Jiangellaceae bacterium]
MNTLVLRGRRDPFAEFDALFRTPFGTDAARRGRFVPAADIVRDGDDAVVSLELPGLDAERDISVEVDGGRLVVTGQRRDERSDDRDGRSLRELRYGTFRRSFTLPQHVTGEDVSAGYDAGILTVRVGGAYSGSTAHRIPVTAGSTASAGESASDTGSDGEPQAA